MRGPVPGVKAWTEALRRLQGAAFCSVLAISPAVAQISMPNLPFATRDVSPPEAGLQTPEANLQRPEEGQDGPEPVDEAASSNTRRPVASKILFDSKTAAPGERRFAQVFGNDARTDQGQVPGSDLLASPGRALFGGAFLGGARGDFWFQAPPARNVAFAGFEASERDRYFSAGMKRAIKGHLDQPGWRFLASFGAKIRDYDPALGLNANRLHAARMSLGYEWHLAALSVSVMAGGSFVLNTTDAIQGTRRLGRVGPVGMVEIWQDWGKADGMVGSRFTALFAMVDQASRSSYIRLRHGFQLAGHAWRLGPEASYSTGESQRRRGVRLQESWRKARLGLHVSEIPFWQARLALSGGAEWRHDRKTGGYLQLSAYMRY